MTPRNRHGVLMCVLLLAAISSAAADDELLETVRVGDISVEYPPGLRDKAFELARAADKALSGRLRAYREQRPLFSDKARIAQMIVSELNMPDSRVDAEEWLRTVALFEELPLRICANYRLLRLEAIRTAAATGKPDIGLPGARMTDAARGRGVLEFNFETKSGTAMPDLKTILFPIVVDAKGRFFLDGERNLARYLAVKVEYLLDSAWLVGPHEATEMVLVANRKLYHPHARWFNDGVANWVALRVLRKLGLPPDAKVYRETLPTGKSRRYRKRVNLLSWAQVKYAPPDRDDERERIQESHYQYATEAISRMFEGQPDDALGSVLQLLKDAPNPDTRQICRSISQVTGRDALNTLLDYVPARIRKAAGSYLPPELVRKGTVEIAGKRWNSARKALAGALEIDPNQRDARVSYAYVLQKLRVECKEVDRQLKVVVDLFRVGEKVNFESKEDADWSYILGRLSQLLGDQKTARILFKNALELAPNHPPSLAAERELNQPKPAENRGGG
jgi:tetratricopeptide (TPR) repeat protein